MAVFEGVDEGRAGGVGKERGVPGGPVRVWGGGLLNAKQLAMKGGAKGERIASPGFRESASTSEIGPDELFNEASPSPLFASLECADSPV